nr:DUF4405 domain-containing protein [uncultured Celeribacter sp.]
MSTLRKFATPLTIGSFFIVGVTGVLWYFHIVTDLGRWLHEIIGLAMVIIVALHVILNWRAFKIYFKRPIALGIIAASLVLTGVAYISLGSQTSGRGGPPNFAAFSAFSDESLTTLGPIFDTTGEILVTRLEDAGYTDVTPQSTIADLAGSNARAQMSAFSVLAADGTGLGGQSQGARAQAQ